MAYAGVKTIGELKLHEVGEPLTDEIYMAVEDNKLGDVPIRPYEFAKWDGTKWVKVPNVQLTTSIDMSNSVERVIAVDYEDLTFPVAEGTQCFHDGGYFYANTDIAASEEWTAAHWTETNVAEQLGNVETLLAAL